MERATLKERIECAELRSKVVPVEDAVKHIKHGDTIAISGFTKSGEPKTFFPALARHLAQTAPETRVTLLSRRVPRGRRRGADGAVHQEAGAVHVLRGLAKVDPRGRDGLHRRAPLRVRARGDVRVLRRARRGGGRGVPDPAGRQRHPDLVGRDQRRGPRAGEADHARGEHRGARLHRVPRRGGARRPPERRLAAAGDERAGSDRHAVRGVRHPEGGRGRRVDHARSPRRVQAGHRDRPARSPRT